MKRFLLSVVLATTLVLSSCQFDDSDIWEKFGELEETIRDHEQRISALEELCKQMNTNIDALQSIVEALQNNDYVTGVVPVTKDGKVIGYTISFTKSQPITIYHGENGANGADGKDGKDGYTPQIGVKQDNDGIYYWTIDGEWLHDANGNKIKAAGVDGNDGTDGKDGVNGTDGKDGVNGKDGITPRLKIENGYWYISYDNENTWIQLGKATGENGKDGVNGTNGTNGDSFFLNVTQDENCVYFTLADGTVITLPKYKAEAEKSNNKIYYTTSDGKKMFPANSGGAAFGAILISNTYENGQGILTFDDTVTTIGENAFYGCTLLTSVTIPDSVTEIGYQAFCYCESLTSATIPSSVTSIGDGAFEYCTSLTSVTIGNSVTSVGSSAFQGCISLTSITIPNSVTEIGSSAFKNCTSLASVSIPDSVTKIGYSAFSGCSSLKEVYCKPTTPPTGSNNMFYDNASDRKIYVPAASVKAYRSANYWSDYASDIVGYDFESGTIIPEAGNDDTGAEATGVYTSDAAFVCSVDNSGNKVYILGASTINGESCSGFKLGTSNNAGFFTSAAVGVSGTKTLGFYAMAWKGKSARLYIKVEGTEEIKSVALKANDGATGNPPYTITVTDDDYYSVELTGLTESSTIVFSTDATFSTASSTASRAIVAGVNLK